MMKILKKLEILCNRREIFFKRENRGDLQSRDIINDILKEFEYLSKHYKKDIIDEIYSRELQYYKNNLKDYEILTNIKNDILQKYNVKNEKVKNIIDYIDRDIQNIENTSRLIISKDMESDIKNWFEYKEYKYYVSIIHIKEQSILQAIFKCINIIQIFKKHQRERPAPKRIRIGLKRYTNHLIKYTKDTQIKFYLSKYKFDTFDISESFINSCLFYEIANLYQKYQNRYLGDNKSFITKKSNEVLFDIFGISKDYRIYENIDTKKFYNFTLCRYKA